MATAVPRLLRSLQAQLRELEQRAQRLEAQEKNGEKTGIIQLRKIITRFGLTPGDVEAALKIIPGRPRKRGVKKGTKLPPRYRNPLNPRQTWAGRGLRPKWLVAQLKQGKKLADFEV